MHEFGSNRHNYPLTHSRPSGGQPGDRWNFFAVRLLLISLLVFAAQNSFARQTPAGSVPAIVSRLKLAPIASVPATNRLHLAIGLPLRDPVGLTNALREIYDPASPNYRHYFTAEQFTERFGPTAQDYESLAAFVQSNGWTINRRHPGRMVLEVEAAAADINRVCHVNLRRYQHPTEPRQFYAPDTTPVLDVPIPIASISGLNDFYRPRPGGAHKGQGAPNSGLPNSGAPNSGAANSGAGSGPQGTLLGRDFRAAYANGTTLTGAGQTVGLLEFDGFYTNDIAAYENLAGLPSVPLTVKGLAGFDTHPVYESDGGEVALDIEMVIAMAPGITNLIVYEIDPDTGLANSALSAMADDGIAAQLSSSWFFQPDATTDQLFQRLAAQGQSFFECSGDDNAYHDGVNFEDHAGPPADDPYVTSVGATTLTLSSQGFWQVETVWNDQMSGVDTNGSGGGISTNYTIPAWQQNTSMAGNGGSTTMRNLPDVAAAGNNIWVISNDGDTGWFWGTSCAAPLWAGFTALVNEQRAALGEPSAGFLNPALYALGNSPGYNAAFHDITTGNNTNSASPHLYPAVTGYDLATGWGTPNGINLINALSFADPLVISPGTTLPVSGAVGGPFAPATQTFTLTNAGNTALNWSAASDSALLTVSETRGQLLTGHATNIVLSLSTNAMAIPAGFFAGDIQFKNVTAGTTQMRTFTLQTGLLPLTFDDPNSAGDEEVLAGYGGLIWDNFYYDDATGSTEQNSGYQAGLVSAPNVIFNGDAKPARIIGVAPFDLLSADLTAAWNDDLTLEVQGYAGTNLLYDQAYTLNATLPTTVHFNFYGLSQAVFTTSGGTHHSGYVGSGKYFVMDNLLVIPHNTPPLATALTIPSRTGNQFNLSWTAQVGQTYQVQSTTNLSTSATWVNDGAPITAEGANISGVGTATGTQRYYRLQLLP